MFQFPTLEDLHLAKYIFSHNLSLYFFTPTHELMPHLVPPPGSLQEPIKILPALTTQFRSELEVGGQCSNAFDNFEIWNITLYEQQYLQTIL